MGSVYEWQAHTNLLRSRLRRMHATKESKGDIVFHCKNAVKVKAHKAVMELFSDIIFSKY